MRAARTKFEAPANLATLTSLRFFAALWVVLYHFLDQLPEWIADLLVPLHFGPRAVDFFFILSGFILAHVYQPSIEAGRFSLRSFYVKRFARLYPVHLAMLALVIGLFFAARLAGMEIHSAGKYDFSRLWMHLLAVHAWFPHGTNSFNIPSWSISAEFFAYLLFPLMAAAMLRIRPRIGLLGLIAATALLFGLAQIVALSVDRPALLCAAIEFRRRADRAGIRAGDGAVARLAGPNVRRVAQAAARAGAGGAAAGRLRLGHHPAVRHPDPVGGRGPRYARAGE
jgi:peptidoglycan/LPS O-acetylase OafA/YrhL